MSASANYTVIATVAPSGKSSSPAPSGSGGSTSSGGGSMSPAGQ
jgi:hypothetical protein